MIPRSSYYKWLTHKGSVLESENKIVMKEIIIIYNKVNGIYGYRRITMNLNSKLKKNYNYKRIYRLMRLSGLQAVIRRKKKRYVKSSPQQVTENILNRKFTADKLNQKWLTDVTEFKYGNSSKAYLSAILDLYDNSIVGYVFGHSNNNRLVFKNLDIVLNASPGASPMIHSDYTEEKTMPKIH